jgi:hypothetical protein
MGMRLGVVLACLVAVLWGCGDQKESGGKKAPKANRPPVVKQVRIVPGLIFQGQDIQADVTGADPDGDKVRYAFQWEINGQVVTDVDGPQLSGSLLRRGDQLIVKVTPSDGKVSGEEIASAPALVRNAPPVIREVEISPQAGSAGEALEARAAVADPDGDAVQLHYIWSANGKVVEGATTERLPTKGFRRGDKVQARAVADDGEAKSQPVNSKEVVLQNSPPRILSQPPERLVSKGYYRYEVKAEDPDGDPLTFRLEGAPPEGMRMHATRGVLEWRFSELPEEPVVVDIRVSDGQGGEAEQRYDFTVPPAGTS